MRGVVVFHHHLQIPKHVPGLLGCTLGLKMFLAKWSINLLMILNVHLPSNSADKLLPWIHHLLPSVLQLKSQLNLVNAQGKDFNRLLHRQNSGLFDMVFIL